MKKISLYKSGVHKILALPRRWALHKPSMGMAVFKKALEMRAKALAVAASTAAVSAQEESSDHSSRKRKRENGNASDEEEAQAAAKQICVDKVELNPRQEDGNESKEIVMASGENLEQEQQESVVAAGNQSEPNITVESSPSADAVIQARAKRKEELEEKLRTITTEKHRLVQLLKQILTNEEETKRRTMTTSKSCDVSSVPQATAPRPLDLEEGELDCVATPTRS